MKAKLVLAAERPRVKATGGTASSYVRRLFIAGPLAVAIAVVGPGGTASAFDELIPTKIGLVRFGGTPAVGKVFKLVSRAPNPPLFQLPSASPVGTGGTLTVGVAPGSITCNLPAQAWDPIAKEGWKALGNPAGSKGYKYTNRNAPGGLGGPCKVVLVKEKIVRVVVKGTGTLPVPVDYPPGNPAIKVKLALGGDNYCAEAPAPHFKEKANRLIKAKDQGAPGSCPTISTTTSTTGTSTTSTTGASTTSTTGASTTSTTGASTTSTTGASTTSTTGASTTSTTGASTTSTTGASTTTTTTILPPALDHYRVYPATGPDAPFVHLEDQFHVEDVDLGDVAFFMVPADKNGEGIHDEVPHLTCYDIPIGTFSAAVLVSNQLDPAFGGPQTLQVKQPDALCVPTEKFPPQPLPLFRDHYKCYEASGDPAFVPVNLSDQFEPFQPGVMVYEPVLFCNPVDKNGEGMLNDVDHLTCYFTDPSGVIPGSIPFRNQFHDAVLDVGPPNILCIPSLKLDWIPIPP